MSLTKENEEQEIADPGSIEVWKELNQLRTELEVMKTHRDGIKERSCSRRSICSVSESNGNSYDSRAHEEHYRDRSPRYSRKRNCQYRSHSRYTDGERSHRGSSRHRHDGNRSSDGERDRREASRRSQDGYRSNDRERNRREALRQDRRDSRQDRRDMSNLRQENCESDNDERNLRGSSRSLRDPPDNSTINVTNNPNTSEVHSSDGIPKNSDGKPEVPETMDAETLVLLGADINNETKGPDLHIEVTKRWSRILKEGLNKETRQELIKKYPPSNNCPFSSAPTLNPEIKSVLSATSNKKDVYQVLNQSQLSAAINATGIALSQVLECKKSSDPENGKLISLLSDSGRILSDLQHSLSITRRAFIIPGLNPLVKTIADGSKVDTLLFGEDFPDRLKSIQAVERSSKAIARSTTNFKYRAPAANLESRGPSSRSRATGQSNNLNWKGPPSKNSRGARQGGQKSRFSQNHQFNRRR